MKISMRQLGMMLDTRLRETTDVAKISRWAYRIYLDNARDIDPEVKNILLDIGRMEDDPQFEYSIDELRDMSSRMIAEA